MPALASKAPAIPPAVHNTPFGDIVDTEDDLQPLVASIPTMCQAVTPGGAAMATATFDWRICQSARLG